ncbi:MAG: segregation/condensation protein A [Clostridia bacterium]|nr:segregation/condensation protein A [Clostridia bacterium]
MAEKTNEKLNDDNKVEDFLKLSDEEKAKIQEDNFSVDDPIQIEGMDAPDDIDSTLKFKLDQFEGPLDLLYHLIKVAKIDIREIFISQITEQYLEMMKDLDGIEMEKAADFTLMAATLLEIKSNKLLPKPQEVIDGEVEDPEEKLYRQLEEYKLFKEASEKLKPLEDIGKFYKQPDDSAGQYRYELPEKLDVDALIGAFSSLLHRVSVRAEQMVERKIEKDRFTVAEKMAQIKDGLLVKKRFKFTELFEQDYSKSEIINTFLALLELLKTQIIKVQQEGTFEEIEIIKRED